MRKKSLLKNCQRNLEISKQTGAAAASRWQRGQRPFSTNKNLHIHQSFNPWISPRKSSAIRNCPCHILFCFYHSTVPCAYTTGSADSSCNNFSRSSYVTVYIQAELPQAAGADTGHTSSGRGAAGISLTADRCPVFAKREQSVW